MRKYFGTDGIRGIAGKTLTSELSYKVGRALGHLLISKKDNPKIIIGKDTRISCDMIENSLVSGLTSVGVNVMIAGVIPTPAIAYLTGILNTDSAIMISASHNPYQDNGIKIFTKDGFKLTDEEELNIEKLIDDPTIIKNQINDKIGKVYSSLEVSQKYIQHIKQAVNTNFEGIKIALDCANGATSSIAPFVFGDLEADIETIGCMPNGTNINDNVGSTKLDTLSDFVKNNDVDFGFAFDGDGDRVLAVDNEGTHICGDKIMFIIAKYLKEKNKLKDNMVVSTVMSNIGFYKALKNIDISSIKTSVGDRYVVEEMKKNHYSLGGEQSGHIILFDYASTGDGILTSVFLTSIIKEKKTTLKKLAEEVTIFPQKLINIKVENKNEVMNDNEILNEYKKIGEELKNKGRILLRPSGTENLIRVMVEAETDEMADLYSDKLAQFIKEKYC